MASRAGTNAIVEIVNVMELLESVFVSRVGWAPYVRKVRKYKNGLLAVLYRLHRNAGELDDF